MSSTNLTVPKTCASANSGVPSGMRSKWPSSSGQTGRWIGPRNGGRSRLRRPERTRIDAIGIPFVDREDQTHPIVGRPRPDRAGRAGNADRFRRPFWMHIGRLWEKPEPHAARAALPVHVPLRKRADTTCSLQSRRFRPIFRSDIAIPAVPRRQKPKRLRSRSGGRNQRCRRAWVCRSRFSKYHSRRAALRRTFVARSPAN